MYVEKDISVWNSNVVLKYDYFLFKRHERNVHSAEMVECPKCNKFYKGKENLKVSSNIYSSTQNTEKILFDFQEAYV